MAASANTSPNAAAQPFLRNDNIMEMATRYREALVLLETKFEAHRRAWEQHMLWVAEQRTKIEKEHPYELSGSTWMAHHALSQGFDRLSAIEHMLCVRQAAFNTWCVHIHRLSLEDIILASMHRPAVGSETYLWRAFYAVAEATDALNEELQLMSRAEQRQSKHIKEIGAMLSLFGDRIRSDKFVLLCSIQQTKETLDQTLSERINLPLSKRQAHERGLEVCVKFLNSNCNPHWIFRSIQRVMFNLSVSTPRQTLITEYFKLEGGDDSDSEDGTREEGEEDAE